jgi:hypothetical protein
MKSGLFEYLNLKKQTLKSKEGRDYTKYIIVSSIKGETFKTKDKIKELGFHWDGKNYQWYIFGNELTQGILDGLKAINAELQTGGGQTENVDDFVKDLEQLKTDIKSSNASPETKVKLESLLDQFLDDLINATDEKAADAQIQAFLEFSHKFRQYSFWNSILIFIQDPSATQVAGERDWEKKFKRKVVDKNKKITINCYNRYYRNPETGKVSLYTMSQQDKDKDYLTKVETGDIPYNQKEVDAAKARRKEVRVRFNQFRDCDVYDIANTTGEPVPEEPKWKGEYDDRVDAIALFNIAKKSLAEVGINVTQQAARSGEGGWSAGGNINISAGATGSGAASTIFHEWAHELLHQKGGKYYSKTMGYFEQKGQLSGAQIHQIKETQVETCSYVLCRYFGLPVGHHPTYLALWQGQGKLSSKQLIKENIATITDVSNFIIKQVDKYSGEFEKAKAQMQQLQQQHVEKTQPEQQ